MPAGYISFTPDVAAGGLGQVKVLQIKDGAYDSAKEGEPGINPGIYQIRIAGFDGIKIPFFGQGKQIFNPIQDQFTVPDGQTTKDFVVPDSAGENVKIEQHGRYLIFIPAAISTAGRRGRAGAGDRRSGRRRGRS